MLFHYSPRTMVIVMILLHSWIGGNGFSTLMMPKLQITRGFATRDLQFGHHACGQSITPFPAIQE
jgi:hypothetical protein